MKSHHSTPLTRAAGNNFIYRKASTGPPDRCLNLGDRVEVGPVASIEVPPTAARTNKKIGLPRRTGGWRFAPLLYWLGAFCLIAGPAAAQPELRIEAGRHRRGWTRRARLVRRAVRRRQHRHRGRAWRQQAHRGGVGLHPQRRCLDPAGQQAGRHRRGWAGRTRRLRRAVRRRQHRHRGRAWRQQEQRGGVGLHPQRRCLDPAGQQAGRHRRGWTSPDKAPPSRCPPTATPPSWAGVGDNSDTGAAWVYTRSGGVWTQQGSKLVGTGAVGQAGQGVSVALSADGNTAIVGGVADNSGTGAAWVYTRSGGVWTQQGSKLVGTGAVGNAGQGNSVALSADGNTAIVGGVADNSYTGAAWVYTRSGDVWTQQGSKLVGTGAVGNASQGHSVALSADGNTAIVGGPHDNSDTGAAWIYTRSGTVWTQQGNKLVGTGAVGNARQGSSVALSADGNTAIVGGISDDRLTGAAWIHTRNGSVWTPGQYLGY